MNQPYFIFDFDGTIADSFELIINIYNMHAGQFKLPVLDSSDRQRLKCLSSKDILKLLGAKIFYLPKIMRLVRKELKCNMQNIQLINGMKDTLDKLHAKGVPLAILTSNSCENVHLFLKTHGIDYFNFVVAESKYKAKQKRLRKVLKHYKIAPQSAVYIGDETRDVLAAQGCGVTAVAVSWGFCHPDVLKAAHPNYLFHTPCELLNLC